MRRIGFFLSLALAGLGSSAQGATLGSEFTGTDLSLQAGQTSTFTLALDLHRAGFVGGRVMIFSGEGEKQTFRIRNGDPTQTFRASFLYGEAGDYAASYVVKARYKETRERFVDLRDWRTICRDILEIGRETLRGKLGLQVARAGGELPDTGVAPPLPPVTGVTPPLPPVTPVPGPIAGAGLPALLALAGLIWARRRKAAAVAGAPLPIM